MTNPHTVTQTEPKPMNTLVFLLLAGLMSIHFATNFSKDGTPFLNITAYIAGTENTPYQWRCLMQPVFGALMGWLDADFIAKLPKLTPLFLKDPLRLTYFFVNSASMLLALVFHRMAAWALFKDARMANASTLVFLLACYFIFVLNPNLGFLLPYDIPALALGSLGLYLLLSGQYIAACVLMPIAVLNRETAFMMPLTLACMILRGRASRQAWPFVLVMLVEWTLVKVGLSQVFKGGSHSATVFLTFFYNLGILLKPWQWSNLLPLLLMVSIGARAALSMQKVNALGMAATVGFIALAVVGVIVETRAFGELLHLQALCMTSAMWAYARHRPSTDFN